MKTQNRAIARNLNRHAITIGMLIESLPDWETDRDGDLHEIAYRFYSHKLDNGNTVNIAIVSGYDHETDTTIEPELTVEIDAETDLGIITVTNPSAHLALALAEHAVRCARANTKL